MVIADCHNELFRDCSRGLDGGAFFAATILNRKDAKTKKGKDAIDAIKDFILLKGDARFCQYFISKYNLDPSLDNTPESIKKSSPAEKEEFVHKKVNEALRDLIPFFRGCCYEDPQLTDHPLQDGRRAKLQPEHESLKNRIDMEQPLEIGHDIVEATFQRLQQTLRDQDLVMKNLEELSLQLSGSRKRIVFQCKLCKFQSKFKTICVTHIENCLVSASELPVSENTTPCTDLEICDDTDSHGPPGEVPEEKEDEIIDDKYWNYKCSEFFLDAIFAITANFESYGDGLGCFIVNKIILPIVHGLKHSNYSSSIHRFITRILCEATPREGLKLIHERFSNRVGKPGHNIHRDRRMEYRIGAAKNLIENLGPNFSKEAVQQVNHTLDIKEELFRMTRISHGVTIRSGRHNPRSDAKDYDRLFSELTATKADQKIRGRAFGNLEFNEDLLEDDRFNQIEFYRWIVNKNKEAKSVLNAKKRVN